MASCLDCRHFKRAPDEAVRGERADDLLLVPARRGECRCLPPVPALFGSRWPTVSVNDHCGQFRPTTKGDQT